MNENNIKEDKKAWKTFVIIMILSLCAGAAGGFVSLLLSDMGIAGGFTLQLKRFVIIISAYIPLLITILEAALYFVYHGRARRLFDSGDRNKEENLNAIEDNISRALMAVGVCQICSLTFMVAFAGGMLQTENTLFRIAVSLAGIILNIILSLYFQKELVNFEKELNPEKRGSVLDVKFQDKWLDSCDEMERSQIYEASYAAFLAVGKTCLILLVCSMFGMMVFHMGVECVFIIGLIWLVQTIAYYVKAMKLLK